MFSIVALHEACGVDYDQKHGSVIFCFAQE